MSEAQINGPRDIVNFVKAGNATFTLLSKRSGVRYTYKVVKTDNNENAYFCSLMTGSDNESSFSYIGMLYNNDGILSFRVGKKSRVNADDASVKGFEWFINNMHKPELSSYMHFFHSGRCGHCNRKLTTPESVLTGFGAICMRRNEEAIRQCLAA